jgi:hypothetical protein
MIASAIPWYTLPVSDFYYLDDGFQSHVADISEEAYNSLREIAYSLHEPILQIGGWPSSFDGLSLESEKHFRCSFLDDKETDLGDRWILFAEFRLGLESVISVKSHKDQSKDSVCLWIRAKDLVDQNFSEVTATLN